MTDHDITAAIHHVANALQRLGNADASTPMGGLEALGKANLDAAERIGQGLDGIASALSEVALSIWQLTNQQGQVEVRLSGAIKTDPSNRND